MARTFGSYSPTVPVATTWEESITFEDESGAAVDLTGYVVEAQLRPTKLSTAVLNLTTALGHWSIPTPANGTVLLTVTPETIAPLLAATQLKRKLYWGIALRRSADNYRIPLVEGKVTLNRGAVQYATASTLAP